MRIFTLHTPSFLPRGTDWEDEFLIGRVISVDPTPSAPRGALWFWAREGKSKKGAALSAGFRCIAFDDIVEVQGTPQAPRQTAAELRAEVQAEAREQRAIERRRRRAVRRRSSR